MKKTITILSLVIFAFVLSSCAIAPKTGEPSATPDIESYWKETVDAPQLEGRLNIGYEDRSVVDRIIDLLDADVTVEIEELNAVGISFCCSIEDAREILKEFFKENLDLRKDLRFIEPNYVRELIEPVNDDVITGEEAFTTSDSEIPDLSKYLWGVDKVHAPQAWAKGYDGTGIVVAVVDTGIDASHPDLLGQVIGGFDPVGETLLSTDTDHTEVWQEAHGTHVSGTIAAKADGVGVTGVAPGAKLLDIPIFQPDYIGDDYVAEGIIWAVDNGANVLSNSWGGKGYSYLLHEAINYAYDNGTVFVTSSGNGYTDEIMYPSNYAGVINVAASTAADGITAFSSRSRSIAVAAPGDYTVLSTVPSWDLDEFVFGQPYAFYGGTSMACPHVSGAVAVLMQKYMEEDLTPYQYRKLIEKGSDDIMAPGFDIDSGWGRLNVENSLDVDPSEFGIGGMAYFITRSLRTRPEEAFMPAQMAGPMPVSEAYVTMIPQDPDRPILFARTNEWGEAYLAGIEPGLYDVYFGNGYLLNPNYTESILRTIEQNGVVWKDFEVTENNQWYWPDIVEFSSKPEVVIESISFYDATGTWLPLEDCTFTLEAINAYNETAYATSLVSSTGGSLTLPDSAPAPLYFFWLAPLEEITAADVVIKGYVEYDNDSDRRSYFETHEPFIYDDFGPYFTAF